MPTSEALSINSDPPLRESVAAFLGIARVTTHAEPLRILLLALLQISADLIALGIVAATAAFVDRVVAGSVNEWTVGTLLVLGALSQGVGWSVFALGQAVRERVAFLMEQRVLDLVADIPTIEHHERPEFQIEVSLLRWQSVWLGGVVNRLVEALGAAVRVVGTLVLLASVHPLLTLLALAALPALAAARSQHRLHQEAYESVVELRRMADGFIDASTAAALAKEVRVFQLDRVIGARYAETQTLIDSKLDEAASRGTTIELLMRTLFGLSFAAALIATALLAARGGVSAGGVLVTAALAAQLTGHLSSASSSLGPLRDASVAAHRLRWLEDYAARVRAAVVPENALPVPTRLNRAIRVEGLGFSYPDSSRPVLHDVSFELPAGSTVAIVGENGAGKTTLVKLLTRMYMPTEGRIWVDDVDLADLDPTEWRRRISAAFQDHARFELLLRESVGISSPHAIEQDEPLVDALARATAEDLIGGPVEGLDAQLGRMFRGGVDLSIGQWQKVALARGLLREDPLLLALDEPTSALDPMAESRLFEGFALAARSAARSSGGVTLLVSHRFSTVRTADLVVVLRAGTVEEIGTHDELMATRGTYQELYELQARAYR